MITLATSKKFNHREVPSWNSARGLIEATFLPVFTSGEERPFEESDFAEHRAVAEVNLKYLNSVISELYTPEGEKNNIFEDEAERSKSSFAVLVTLLCGEHACCALWTSEMTRSESSKLLHSVIGFLGHKYITALLVESEGKLLKCALLMLRPKLLKNTWKKYPAAVSCYMWILLQTKVPHLSPHLNNFLPTALIIIDDHVRANKVTGLNCLEHIVNNVTRSDLSMYGEGEVIYKAVEPMLYLRELKIIPALASCLVAILKQIEPSTYCLDYQWGRYDHVMDNWLQAMYLEQKLAAREAYMKSLALLLESIGLRCVRWIKRLMIIFDEYITEPSSRLISLKSLEVFLLQSWFRAESYCERVVGILLKALYDTTESAERTGCADCDMVEQIEKCLCLLKQSAPTAVQRMSDNVRTQLKFSVVALSIINRTFCVSHDEQQV